MPGKQIKRKEPQVPEEAVSQAEPLPNPMLAVQRAQEMQEAIRKVLRIAVQQTNPEDWVDQGDKPYLTAAGAEKIRVLFGISFKIVPTGQSTPYLIENHPDGHYTITFEGEFTFAGQTISVIGSRSSNDPFFCKRYINGREVQLPPQEIDIKDVIMAAYSNLIMNGITRILGIRNLTWEMLRDAGLDLTKIKRVVYRQKPQQPLQQPYQQSKQPPNQTTNQSSSQPNQQLKQPPNV
ncbi:MAG: hypothetical protein ABIK73_06790 [candidate division WOR-3 bacterium]